MKPNAKKKVVQRQLVADQRKVTVYYPEIDLDQMHQAVREHNRTHAYEVKHARVLYALGHLWRLDPHLQERVDRFLVAKDGQEEKRQQGVGPGGFIA